MGSSAGDPTARCRAAGSFSPSLTYTMTSKVDFSPLYYGLVSYYTSLVTRGRFSRT
jgi:hypothetical protein